MTLLSLAGVDGAGDLSTEAFERIRAIVHRECGVVLSPRKRALMRSRLRERVRALGLESFDAYADLLESEGGRSPEWSEFLDRITTHHTRFFREPAALELLSGPFLDELTARERPRVVTGWCAACSTGQEPASIVMAALEALRERPGFDVRIRATDVSERVLARAGAAVYTTREAADLGEERLRRWTEPAPGGVRLSSEVTGRIRYSRSDLLHREEWPDGPPFDFVFCRNVMIYLDAGTRLDLIRKLVDRLRPGGLLAIGAAEALPEAVPELEPIATAVYRRPA